MTTKRPNLEQIQRWMQSVIMHPGGVAEGVESPQAREHLDVTLAGLEDVIRRSRALASSARLEIYVDAYYERLLECLREEFGATRYAVGDELFDALAFGYLQHYPSRSYTLFALGGHFPQYLDESRLHAQAVPEGVPSTWPDFVVELAAFERLQREVYDVPGTEDMTLLDGERLSRVPPSALGSARLTLAPCLRLYSPAHPVQDFWLAWRRDGQAAVPELRRTYLVVNRRDYTLVRHELTIVQFAVVEALAAGGTLAEAIAAAYDVAGNDSQFEEDLGDWFATWTRAGFFVGVEGFEAAAS